MGSPYHQQVTYRGELVEIEEDEGHVGVFLGHRHEQQIIALYLVMETCEGKVRNRLIFNPVASKQYLYVNICYAVLCKHWPQLHFIFLLDMQRKPARKVAS